MRRTIELSHVVIEPWSREADQCSHAAHGGLSLSVADGAVVAVAGLPGFGGTTLARLVAGIARPKSGCVIVNRADVTSFRAVDRPVGLVPVDGGLLPYLTLEENITYGARLAGEANAFIQYRLGVLARQLDLLPSLALRPHEVSAGQRVRAALARVAMRQVQARVLVVDATSGAQGMAGLRKMIERVWPPPTASVLLCTRNADVIGQADRVIWIERCRAAWNAPLDKLRESPPTLAVAELVLPGPITKLSCVAASSGVASGSEAECDGLRLPLLAAIPDGRHIIVVLTADSIELGPPDQGIAARVVTTNSLADPAHILVEPDCRPGQRWAARAITASPAGAGQVRRGDRVGARIRADRIFVFDAETPDHALLAPEPEADR